MQKFLAVPVLFVFLFLTLALTLVPAEAADQDNVKEWTFITFLNGYNNLDEFGATNINQMEKVGSTDDVNVVVQWASLKTRKTKRLYVIKDEAPREVTSPILEEVKDADMGDWRTLVDFIRWSVEHYPAKRYFINVWNHGNGWHDIRSLNFFKPEEISYDDISGNAISTPQLGMAMAEAARIIGHKVDLYASDACLMGMLEIADEMGDSVSYFGGSEEVEPGDGWPYDAFLKRWVAKPDIEGAELGKILTEEYVKAYSGGQFGMEEVQFAIFDLARITKLNEAVAELGRQLLTVEAANKAKIMRSIAFSQRFSLFDYVDLGDFTVQVEKLTLPSLSVETLAGVRSAIQEFVVINKTTPRYQRALGVSLWIPNVKNTYNRFAAKYDALKFNEKTRWNDALRYLLAP